MLALYKNIKRMREKHEMSQDSLAKLTGYTDRSSITKIEKGLVDLQQSKIKLFAEALRTTPSVLMGWEEDYEFKDTSAKSHLSFDSSDDFAKAYDKSKLRNDELTISITDNLEALNNGGKKMVLDYSRMLLDNPQFTPAKEETKEHLIPIAAHNDNSDEEQLRLMQEDIDEL